MDKTQKDLDLYFLTRNVQWRYRLDVYEDAVIREMLKTVRAAVADVQLQLFNGDTAPRGDALLDELQALSAGLRKRLGEDVADMATEALNYSAQEHASILSIDGRVPINNVALSAGQFRAFLGGPAGGVSLPAWVDAAWGSTVTEQVKRNLNIAVLQGEGYQKAVRGLLESSIADFTEREAITIARTYVQTANVAAQMAVYEDNDDLVKGWRWSSVLEPGYSKTGRGTCLRCASLDQRQFKMGEGPPIPLHPRCRCVALPVLKTWRDLGLDRDELDAAIRPYTIRPDTNIDAGGMRTIIESGRHQGDYASWWAKQPEAFKINAVGPGRYELLKSGKISFADLVDGDGRQRTLSELVGGAKMPISTQKSAPLIAEKALHPFESMRVELDKKYGIDKIYSMATDSELEKFEMLERDFYMAQKEAGRLAQATVKVKSAAPDAYKVWADNDDVRVAIDELMEKAWNDDGYDYFGVRVNTDLSDMFSEATLRKSGIDPKKKPTYKVGDILEPSFVWDDNELTSEMLDGTSTLVVKRGDARSIQNAVKLLNQYAGRDVILAAGEDALFGQDEGELILKNAKVLNIWKRK